MTSAQLSESDDDDGVNLDSCLRKAGVETSVWLLKNEKYLVVHST